jgi:hypothetical protein
MLNQLNKEAQQFKKSVEEKNWDGIRQFYEFLFNVMLMDDVVKKTKKRGRPKKEKLIKPSKNQKSFNYIDQPLEGEPTIITGDTLSLMPIIETNPPVEDFRVQQNALPQDKKLGKTVKIKAGKNEWRDDKSLETTFLNQEANQKPAPRRPATNMVQATCSVCHKTETISTSLYRNPYKCNDCCANGPTE